MLAAVLPPLRLAKDSREDVGTEQLAGSPKEEKSERNCRCHAVWLGDITALCYKVAKIDDVAGMPARGSGSALRRHQAELAEMLHWTSWLVEGAVGLVLLKGRCE